MSEISSATAPLTCGVEVGGALVNPKMGRQSAYIAAVRGDLPTIQFGRRRYVCIARLQEKLGRPITAADIARAEEIVRGRKRQAESAVAQ